MNRADALRQLLFRRWPRRQQAITMSLYGHFADHAASRIFRMIHYASLRCRGRWQSAARQGCRHGGDAATPAERRHYAFDVPLSQLSAAAAARRRCRAFRQRRLRRRRVSPLRHSRTPVFSAELPRKRRRRASFAAAVYELMPPIKQNIFLILILIITPAATTPDS